jgi:hypothetical protein
MLSVLASVVLCVGQASAAEQIKVVRGLAPLATKDEKHNVLFVYVLDRLRRDYPDIPFSRFLRMGPTP